MIRNISQDGRSLKLISTLSESGIALTDFCGTDAISQEFQYNIHLLAKKQCLDLDALLGTNVTIQINDQLNTHRYFNGVVEEISYGLPNTLGLHNVQAKLMPWFSLLKLSTDCRIFQNKTVPQIFSNVCKDLGFYHFDVTQLTQRYEPLEYSVQYNETNFNFLSRLLEREGIYYYFQHFEDRHVMILADKVYSAPLFSEIVEYNSTKRSQQYVYKWKDHRQFQTETDPILEIEGKGNIAYFQSGLRFNIVRNDEQDQYFIIKTFHQAYDRTHLNETIFYDQLKHTKSQCYYNKFLCIPSHVDYKPPQITPRPIIDGFLSAIVTSQNSEEIHTDEYGRVKVYFHWDRRGVENARSSCWISVLQPIAGSSWGCQFLPRVGQEVMVEFLHGCSDQPVITGTLYNFTHRPPYSLPEQENISGIKTHTIGSDNFYDANELCFDDRLKEENLLIQAQRNLISSVNRQKELKIDGDLKSQIANSRVVTTKKSAISAKNYISLQSEKGNILITPDQISIVGDEVNMGELGSLPTGNSNILPQSSANEWLAYFHWNVGSSPTVAQDHSYCGNFSQSEKNKQHALEGTTDPNGFGPLPIPEGEKIELLNIAGAEIIKQGQKPIAYPCDTVKLDEQQFTTVKENRLVYGIPMKVGEKKLDIYSLRPPIIINLREDAKQRPNTFEPKCLNDYSRTTLSQEEIAYFKGNGNNAMIFIHGFNVPYGRYPKQIRAIDVVNKPKVIGRVKIMLKETLIHYGKSERTIYRDPKAIYSNFHKVYSCELPRDFKQERINGLDAHSWFVYMEDNLNMAAGEFQRNNYLNYHRILNVTWTGDSKGGGFNNTLNYMANEDYADRAGHRLVDLIKQLKEEGITINIIAHSLGCRVLLTAMNDLGKEGLGNIIDHAFLWEAAVPSSALSKDPSRDTSIKNNSHFIYASEATKKITVLYSKHDFTLSYFVYMIANGVGVAPANLKHRDGWQAFFKGHRRMFKRGAEIFNDYNSCLFNEDIRDMITGKKAYGIDNNVISRYKKYGKEVERLFTEASIRPALGHNGPDLNDSSILNMLKNKKLILANQSEWLFDHSGMKSPSAELMENVYKKYIIGGFGISKFGLINVRKKS